MLSRHEEATAIEHGLSLRSFWNLLPFMDRTFANTNRMHSGMLLRSVYFVGYAGCHEVCHLACPLFGGCLKPIRNPCLCKTPVAGSCCGICLIGNIITSRMQPPYGSAVPFNAGKLCRSCEQCNAACVRCQVIGQVGRLVGLVLGCKLQFGAKPVRRYVTYPLWVSIQTLRMIMTTLP